MSVKHCGNCQNFVANREGESPPICSKGHEPTFKIPRSPVDMDYGYRRNCNDFKQRQEASPHETIVMPADIKLVNEDTLDWLTDLGRKYKHELYDDIFNGTEYHIVELAESDGIDRSQLETYKREINKLLLFVLLQQA